jgi:PIN domain nuclease of toxin-antitoxin system
MVYVADTMALVWHLEKKRKLGKQTQRILEEADQGHHTIALSGATLMEILYLSERQRISVDRQVSGISSLVSRAIPLSPLGSKSSERQQQLMIFLSYMTG